MANPIDTNVDVRDKVFIIINGQEIVYNHIDVDVDFDNDNTTTILNKVNGIIQEARGTSLTDSSNEYTYTVTKISDTRNIFIYPKPDAGK